jgi:multidrug efflux pump subunit AcrA (membrane-fusion protein)
VTPAPVELGALAGNDVAVTSGFTAGARVVVDGILKVVPGVPVNAVSLADGAALKTGPGSAP